MPDLSEREEIIEALKLSIENGLGDDDVPITANELLRLLAQQQEGWRPIETAPVRRPLLLGNPTWDGVVAEEWPNEVVKRDHLAAWENGPTHWAEQPSLPSAPLDTKETT